MVELGNVEVKEIALLHAKRFGFSKKGRGRNMQDRRKTTKWKTYSPGT